MTEQSLDVLYLKGDDELGIEGLFNQSIITKLQAAITIEQIIASNKPEDVIKLFGSLYNKVYVEQTNTIHVPTHFSMPVEQKLLLE